MQPRSQTLRTRIRPHEEEAVEAVAEQLGKSKAEFTRDAVLDAVRRVQEADHVERPLGEWRSGVIERSA